MRMSSGPAPGLSALHDIRGNLYWAKCVRRMRSQTLRWGGYQSRIPIAIETEMT